MKIALLLMAGLLCAGIASAETQSSTAAKKKLYHVVSIKFKDSAGKAEIQKVEEAFKELKKKIPQIQTLEWGTNVSPEHHNKGFTHCFVLTFKSDQDRNTYLNHAAHKAFGQLLGPVMADVFVIDFWAQN
jgi:hypothetical protein